MPLADFVRYLNAQQPDPRSALRPAMPFVSEDGKVHVVHSGLRLESAFAPIISTDDGWLRGHGARLQAIDETHGRLFDSEFVYTLPHDDKEFIFLDRLVRTLHTLNYLTYRERQARQLLLLKVHPRHVASVSADHGLVFEEILRSCGLMPEQITLEFDVVNGGNIERLVQAIANYRSRGYGIAIGGLGGKDVDFSLLQRISPTIVTLDLARWQTVPTPQFKLLVDRLHELGAQVMSEGPDSVARRDEAQRNGVDLWQVKTPLPRLLHAPAAFSTAALEVCKAA